MSASWFQSQMQVRASVSSSDVELTEEERFKLLETSPASKQSLPAVKDGYYIVRDPKPPGLGRTITGS